MHNTINLSGDFYPENTSYEKIIHIQHECLYNSANSIEITFNGCKFICPGVLTIIGALPSLGSLYGKSITLDIQSFDSRNLKDYMFNYGFINYLCPKIPINLAHSNAITFRKFSIEDFNDTTLLIYIDNILRLAPVKMLDEVKNELISKLYEIFANAFEHSKSKVGVFGCGYYFPTQEMLYFSLYDAGVGIPSNVKGFLRKEDLNSGLALEWAFKRGNSTVTNIDYPRGLGLDFLKEFIKLNQGNIIIYSNNSTCTVTSIEEKYNVIDKNLVGTLFSIAIKADKNNIYDIRPIKTRGVSL